MADMGTLQRLPAIVGHGVATELALTARDFSGRLVVWAGIGGVAGGCGFRHYAAQCIGRAHGCPLVFFSHFKQARQAWSASLPQSSADLKPN